MVADLMRKIYSYLSIEEKGTKSSKNVAKKE
jgi:hypothetical protein